MNNYDRIYFPLEMERFDFKRFTYNYALGMRTYLAKENYSNLDYAKKKYLRLERIHLGILLVFYVLLAVALYAFVCLMGMRK